MHSVIRYSVKYLEEEFSEVRIDPARCHMRRLAYRAGPMRAFRGADAAQPDPNAPGTPPSRTIETITRSGPITHPPARPGLIHPTAWKRCSANFRFTVFLGSSRCSGDA